MKLKRIGYLFFLKKVTVCHVSTCQMSYQWIFFIKVTLNYLLITDATLVINQNNLFYELKIPTLAPFYLSLLHEIKL